MKVLFLDVDGVLNSSRSRSALALSKGALRRLKVIIGTSQAKLVLSSSWRIRDTTEFGSLPYRKLVHALRHRGLSLYGETAVTSMKRGSEIALWLNEHGPVDKYAILDDDSDMLPEQLPNFFQTDPDYGLTDTIAYRVTYHLTHLSL